MNYLESEGNGMEEEGLTDSEKSEKRRIFQNMCVCFREGPVSFITQCNKL